MSEAADIFAWPDATISTVKAVIALVGAALLALDIALRRSGRGQVRRRLRDRLLVATAAAAALAWMRLAPLGVWNHVHPWELYHHALGAKYFAELGYTGLYDCTLIADVEAGFGISPDRRPVRRLADNRVETGAAVLASPDPCRDRFGSERWAAFQRDLAVFRGALVERRWASMLTDHGFNASPAWLVTAATLVPSGPFTWEKLRWLARIDLALLAATAAAGFWGFGLRGGCAALIFFGTHYLGEYGWLGGAFLRYDWLALAAIGAALVYRGKLAAGGFALTWAALLRVFPGFLVAAVVLHAAIDLVRRRTLVLAPPYRRFALGCLLALATLLPLSVAIAGRDAWPAFVANSRKHLATPLLNFVGWKSVVAFDTATTAGTLRNPALADPYETWHVAVRETFARREAVYLAGVAGFAALLAVALARTPLAVSPLLGVGLVVVAAQIGSYYYAILLGYGLLAARFDLLGPALLLGAAASLAIADLVTGSSDVVMAALSALWTAFAVGATVLALRRER